ncbi:MAG TPA: hypothetical protein ENI67_10705 [Gammaproteobacteria bacterium]|nr:hypothetical protein [Gammaproteobacteria bacterium]
MQKRLFIVIAVFSTSSALADSVKDMCLGPDKVCTCAASKLKSEIGDEDYVLYEAIGTSYIANKSKGMSMEDAWDAAVKAEASKRGAGFIKTLNKTNSFGSELNNAIISCSG